MLVDFDKLPLTSRVWVYMSDRKFKADEEDFVGQKLSDFTEKWAAHGTPLSASFEIRNNQFVVLAVDDRVMGPSGCSIDSSVKVMKSIQEHIGVDFFNRNLIPLQLDGEIVIIERKHLKKNLDAGVWNGLTLTFNVLAASLGELQSSWLIETERSWLKTYLKTGVTP